MLQDESAAGAFWCPTDEKSESVTRKQDLDMTLATGRHCHASARDNGWSDVHLDRLQSLGLIERVFGQPLLTRLGRSTVGIET